MRLFKLILLTAIIASTFSCAIALTGTRESITVVSTTPGADAKLSCAGRHAASGVTPTTLTFWRNAADCMLKLSKSGYADDWEVIDQGVSPVYWMNFLTAPADPLGAFMAGGSDRSEQKALGVALMIAGASTWLFDYRTGATHTHRSSAIRVTLRPKE
jgi:hypothetical protein